MKPAIKVLVQVIGTLVGIVGVRLLFSLLRLLLQGNPGQLTLVLSTISCGLLPAYFFYVTYLVWRRFSSFAVQHVVFEVTLIGFAVALDRQRTAPQSGWSAKMELASLAIFALTVLSAFVFYKVFSFALRRVLFPPPDADMKPPV